MRLPARFSKRTSDQVENGVLDYSLSVTFLIGHVSGSVPHARNAPHQPECVQPRGHHAPASARTRNAFRGSQLRSIIGVRMRRDVNSRNRRDHPGSPRFARLRAGVTGRLAAVRLHVLHAGSGARRRADERFVSERRGCNSQPGLLWKVNDFVALGRRNDAEVGQQRLPVGLLAGDARTPPADFWPSGSVRSGGTISWDVLISCATLWPLCHGCRVLSKPLFICTIACQDRGGLEFVGAALSDELVHSISVCP